MAFLLFPYLETFLLPFNHISSLVVSTESSLDTVLPIDV